jgi:hypothetical protein
MEKGQSLPIATVLPPLTILPARGAEQGEDFNTLAKIAAYSTDKENDQYSSSA